MWECLCILRAVALEDHGLLMAHLEQTPNLSYNFCCRHNEIEEASQPNCQPSYPFFGWTHATDGGPCMTTKCSSRASGNDSIGLVAYSTNWFMPCLEGEEHLKMFAMDFGVVPASGSQVYEGSGSISKFNLRSSTTLGAPPSCGCLAHNNQMGMAKRPTISSAQHAGPVSSTGSMIQSNSYASSSRFEDKAKIRALMEARGLKKEPGWSRIEIQGQLNTFLVDDKSHPRNEEIREELQKMLEVMKDAGYVADLRCVLRDIPEAEKEQALQLHSERLAMALGHISLPPRAPMRIIKNLRVCNDCHVATKYFAYLYKREIIVRDATRFHHFREGYCSCGDYW